ncbi:MAG: class I SAM-dependent methyltransferase [Gaiellaceae bacterium]
MAISELRKLLDELPGWLTHEEGETLYRLAKACTGRGVIVEIGSWRGKSTTCLGLGSKAGNRVPVYAVDPHAKHTFADFRRNIEAAGISDLVTPVPGRSQELAAGFQEPIELLFIDGAHQYELVRDDFDHWVPKVVEGGVVAMHDTTWFEGPKRVADELIFKSRRFKDARYVFSSTTVATKVAENTAAERLRNRFGLLVKRSVELTRRVADKDRIPEPLQRLGRRVLRGIQ